MLDNGHKMVCNSLVTSCVVSLHYFVYMQWGYTAERSIVCTLAQETSFVTVCQFFVNFWHGAPGTDGGWKISTADTDWNTALE